MERSFANALKNRRSYYSITNQSPISPEQIVSIINLVVTHVPSAFNSQSTRVVLLLGENHGKLWQLVKDTLQKRLPAEAFQTSRAKIDGSFAAGYGTVLFFEDQSVVQALEQAYPTYKESFPIFSWQTSAMHQLAVWTLLEEAGLGASLQHYNPLIDTEVHRLWNLPAEWMLVAQMPFGAPLAEPGEKSFQPLTDRVKVFE